ncbi:MAG: metallophosphoesterase [Eggerthellaceae bacterium]|jgi:ser/thr phosphatase family protein
MTYVISDIHGMYDKYEEILRKIDFKESDVLYVIGDVVDRGEAPMKVLLDMMSRPNVYPLMGNHDLIALELLPKVDKALVKSGELDVNLSQALQVWISNAGKTTLSDFCKLDSRQRRKVIDYLREFTLLETVDVGDKSFVLVHAGFGNYKPGKKLSEYTDDDLLSCRPDPSQQYFDDNSIFTVMGHTPTPYFSGKPEIYKNGRNIFIDCGACYPKGRLGCLCLDTFEEFYV